MARQASKWQQKRDAVCCEIFQLQDKTLQRTCGHCSYPKATEQAAAPAYHSNDRFWTAPYLNLQRRTPAKRKVRG